MTDPSTFASFAESLPSGTELRVTVMSKTASSLGVLIDETDIRHSIFGHQIAEQPADTEQFLRYVEPGQSLRCWLMHHGMGPVLTTIDPTAAMQRVAAHGAFAASHPRGSHVRGKVVEKLAAQFRVDFGDGVVGLLAKVALAHTAEARETSFAEIEVGHELECVVQQHFPKNESLALNRRDLVPDPWADAVAHLDVGVRADLEVVSIDDEVVCLAVTDGVLARLPTEELHWDAAQAPAVAQGFTPGRRVEVVVCSLDARQHILTVSARRLEPRPQLAAVHGEQCIDLSRRPHPDAVDEEIAFRRRLYYDLADIGIDTTGAPALTADQLRSRPAELLVLQCNEDGVLGLTAIDLERAGAAAALSKFIGRGMCFLDANDMRPEDWWDVVRSMACIQMGGARQLYTELVEPFIDASRGPQPSLDELERIARSPGATNLVTIERRRAVLATADAFDRRVTAFFAVFRGP